MRKPIKRLFMLVAIGCLFLQNCNGQKKEYPAGKEELPTFEEKQKLSLQNEKPLPHNLTTAGFSFRYAAKKATPGVVHIKSVFPASTEREVPDLFKDFFGEDFWHHYFQRDENNTPEKQVGSASGVIVSSDGYIVTNNHVVNGAESIEIVLHDQRSYKAKIIGTDPTTDLALLKIDEKKLSFIEFGNSDSVEVGDIVLAVGNPFNLASTVTEGIVSAKARNINVLTDRWAVESYIQTDAAMNPGNSGGALVDINGKLIGINAAIASPNGAYAGYSFAIPVEIVKKTIDDLLRHGKVLHGYLGVAISDMDGDKAKMLGISTTTGVMVDSLQPNGAAMKAGIQTKDVIIQIDAHNVEATPQLREIVSRSRPGEKLQIKVIRDGKEKIIPVTIMAADGTVAVATSMNKTLKTLGIEIANLTAKEKNQLKVSGGIKVVSINSGKIASQTNMKEGFIITKVNGKTVNTINEFIGELQNRKDGIMLQGIYPGVPSIYYYAFGL